MLNIQASIGMDFERRNTAGRARLIGVDWKQARVWMSRDGVRMWPLNLDEFADSWLPVSQASGPAAPDPPSQPEPWRPSVDEWDLLPDA